MAGTAEGGRKAMKTAQKRYGKDYPSKIGSKGRKAAGRRFDDNTAAEFGSKGGRRSKRGSAKRVRPQDLASYPLHYEDIG